MDRIVHGVNTLTCALHEDPNIACDNQLSAIKALHQAIQIWAKLTIPALTKPHCTTLPHTSTQQRSILRPMCRPHEDQPPDVPPRVAIPKTNAYPITTPLPSITSQYEPVAQHTRSRFPHTVDHPPPRVNKTPGTAPITRHTRSQTVEMANVIAPAQASQPRYPAKFLQSLAMPVPD